MTHQLYRNTTLGFSLQDTLDQMIQGNLLSPMLANAVLLKFDKVMCRTLGTKANFRLSFKAERLNTYRFCDNVWTFLLDDVVFKDVLELCKVDRVKIVACDGKNIAEELVSEKLPNRLSNSYFFP